MKSNKLTVTNKVVLFQIVKFNILDVKEVTCRKCLTKQIFLMITKNATHMTVS